MYRLVILLLLLILQVYGGLVPLDSLYFSRDNPELHSVNNSKLGNDIGVLCDGGVLPIEAPGTYYLSTSLPKNISGVTHLFLAPSPYAVKISLNGHAIYQWGIGDSTRCIANYNAEAVRIPVEFLDSSTNTIVLAFVSDGARIAFPQLMVGDQFSVTKQQFYISLLNSVTIKIIIGIAVFAFLFLLLYFVFSGCNDVSVIYLSLFCLSLIAGYNMFIFNEYYFDQVVLFKVARIGGALMSLSIFLFITSVTGILATFMYRVIVSAAFVPYLIMILNASTKFQINTIFNASTNTLIFPLLLAGFVILVLGLIKSKRLVLLAVLIPYISLMGAVFSDMGNMIQFHQPVFWKIPYGYLFVILGGTFTILYNRVRQTKMLEKMNLSLVGKVENLENVIKEESQLHYSFLQDLSVSMCKIDELFVELLKENSSTNSTDSFYEVYKHFIWNTLTSSNMLYLSKLKNKDLCLFYDGFSLKTLLSNKSSVFTSFAENHGVELNLLIATESFPPLVWGDEQAVLQVVANVIATAVEIDVKNIVVQIHYISYNGLEIVLSSPDLGFSSKILDVLSTGVLNCAVFPVSVVLQALLKQLDSECVGVNLSQDESVESVRILLSLKLSE